MNDENGNKFVTWPQAISIGLMILIPLLGVNTAVYFKLSTEIKEAIIEHTAGLHPRSATQRELDKLEHRVDKLENKSKTNVD